MIRGIYISGSGMLVQQLNFDTISNNLANVETPGFKKDSNVISPFHEELLFHIENNNGLKKKSIGRMAYGAAAAETVTSFEQGDVQYTGRTLDAAIEGEGFFVVQEEEGVRVTRNGRFRLDTNGYLVTGEGYRVLGHNGFIQLSGEDVQIDSSGAITQDGVEASRLLVITFEDADRIVKDGSTLFFAPEDLQPSAADYKVIQRCLEKSNVDVAQEISNMVIAARAYEANQRLVQAYDRILEQSVKELGSLK